MNNSSADKMHEAAVKMPALLKFGRQNARIWFVFVYLWLEVENLTPVLQNWTDV